MTDQDRPRRQPAVVYALYLNAALLGGILLVLLGRGGGGGPSFLPSAFAGPQGQPIAGGGTLYLMPAQFSQSTWGCYVMDTDKQTLCAYQYFPNNGEKSLRFVAARQFSFDLRRKNFNTFPDPLEMKALGEAEQNGARGIPPAPEAAPAETNPNPTAPETGGEGS